MKTAAEILGVAPKATDDEIRAAYLNRIREHPPDSSPEEFERIRDAWETLRDPRRRAKNLLFGDDPNPSLASLLEGRDAARQFVGPGPWKAALKELSKRG
jgi:curved DNA-binding protein CbpA